MPDTVFLSWSKEPSGSIARELQAWIRSVIPTVEVFLSKDIEKGREWGSTLKVNLSNACFGMICITKNNINEPWILFEAGALYRNFDITRVAPILFGVRPADLGLPLAQLQATLFNEEDMRFLAATINQATSIPLPRDFVDQQAGRVWSEFSKKIESILGREEEPLSKPEAPPSGAELQEMLSRTTEMVQSIYRIVSQSGSSVQISPRVKHRISLNEKNEETNSINTYTRILKNLHARAVDLFAKFEQENKNIETMSEARRTYATIRNSRKEFDNIKELIVSNKDLILTDEMQNLIERTNNIFSSAEILVNS
jgi:hypothetical protein